MSPLRRPAVLVVCAALVACGPVVSGQRRDEIVGGWAAPDEVRVFRLQITGDNAKVTWCSATLIGDRTLLTAAHCVDPARLGAMSVTLTATNKADASTATAADYRKVISSRMHPQQDVALLLLESSPGLTPRAWNSQPIDTFGGRPLRALGYGTTGPSGEGAGVRREVPLTFRQISAGQILIGDQIVRGICNGDSGGPSLHVFADGVERVVGVHASTKDETCVDGTDTRVDAVAGFIQAWIYEKEPPACWDDGRCVAGCATVDLDCVCQADGVCSDKCPSVLRDPDCNPDCVTNGVCAKDRCPRPDVDCGNFSGTCARPQDCLAGRCVTDPQHVFPYCSASCAKAADCPAGMLCDSTATCRFSQLPVMATGAPCTPGQQLCEPNAMCVAATCMAMCTRDADCSAGGVCVTDVNGLMFCRVPLTLERLRAEGKVAPAGCSAAPGNLWALALLLGAAGHRSSKRGQRRVVVEDDRAAAALDAQALP